MNINLLTYLEENISTFTTAQKKVADYIIHDPLQAAFSTIDQIAHTTNVSTTSVVRLALACKYECFSDFQADLQEYLKTNSSPSEKMLINIHREISAREGDKRRSKLVTSNSAENLEKTLRANTESMLDSVVDVLTTANHFYICGNRSTYAVAYYLNFNLNRMFQNSDLLDGSVNNLPEYIPRMHSNDVFIAIGLSRYTKETVQITAAAKKTGMRVISIVDSLGSPLARYADYCLRVYCKTNDFHNTILAPVYLIDILINMCSAKEAERIRQNLLEQEKYIAELGIMTGK